jgi:hypothetical protein
VQSVDHSFLHFHRFYSDHLALGALRGSLFTLEEAVLFVDHERNGGRIILIVLVIGLHNSITAQITLLQTLRTSVQHFRDYFGNVEEGLK